MKPNTRKALRLLKDAGDQGITTGQFLEHGIGRFSARIAELREAGHHITSRRESNNRHRYFLKSPQIGAVSDVIGAEHGADLGGPPPAQGAQGAQNPRTTPDQHPAGPDPSPRVRRGDPLFSYDHPPSIAGEWIFCIECVAGEGTDSYWLRTDISDQKELVAA